MARIEGRLKTIRGLVQPKSGADIAIGGKPTEIGG